MKKILLFSLLLSLVIVSDAQKIRVGLRQKFYLSENEQAIPLDDNIVKKYSILDPDTIHQVPLQAYIKGNDYEIFIGLALYDSPQTIYDYYMLNNDYNILDDKLITQKHLSYFKILAKFDGKYNLKYIFRTKKSYHTVVVNILSDNRNLLTDFFNDEKFIFARLGLKYKK